jgi:hypothetical protein
MRCRMIHDQWNCNAAAGHKTIYNNSDLILRSAPITARLEGWQRVRAVHPSFETAAQEGGLLRMRSELFHTLYDAATHSPSWHGVKYETNRRPLPAVRHLTYCMFTWLPSLPTSP